jgi:hypothetical protein
MACADAYEFYFDPDVNLPYHTCGVMVCDNLLKCRKASHSGWQRVLEL